MTEQIKRLKLCIKWFQQVDENHVLNKEKLQSAMESVEKKCKDNGSDSISIRTMMFYLIFLILLEFILHFMRLLCICAFLCVYPRVCM
jgi:hypothetical protein